MSSGGDLRGPAGTAGRGEVDWDPAVEPAQPDRSLGELVGTLAEDLGDLIRKEVELARVEAKEEVDRVKRAAIGGGVAAVGGLLALIMLSLALAGLLDEWMDRGLADLVVGGLWVIVALVGVSLAKKALATDDHFPRTTQTLQEDAQWIRERRS